MSASIEEYAIKTCKKAVSSFKQDYPKVNFIINKLTEKYGPEWNCITGKNPRVNWELYCEEYEVGLTIEINEQMFSIYQE